MAKVRCNECKKITEEKEGFCEECGALFQGPLTYVTEEEIEAAEQSKRLAEGPKKKKSNGLFGFLKKTFEVNDRLTENDDDETKNRSTDDDDDEEIDTSVLDAKPLSERKIRCNECRAVSLGIGNGYCGDCGAIFVPPYTYADIEKTSKKEKEQVAKFIQSLASSKKTPKPFNEMNIEEKIKFLNENIEDLRDKTVTQRHFITEKSNECMQCFTSAGSIRSNDHDEVLASIIKRRFDNLAEFDPTYIEYKRMLEELKETFEELQNSKLTLINLKKELPTSTEAQPAIAPDQAV